MRYGTLLILILLGNSCPACAQSLVAETAPLTPTEQLSKFHLPPGFEIQLVAQEPDIHKPMNMKFDAHGRLWVTHSLEYPFPAPSDESARDAISVFSDLAADGKARKIQRFAEHLNIPIGVLPLGGGEALAWSIPNIYRLVDTDGDSKADKKTIAFGPFGAVDTHGDQNALTNWIDGWVYANHGFANDSHVKLGGQGPEALHLQSGNTYRFRPDGSAIEQYSWGQVNPFGLSFDPLGNLFSADCHSSAVSLLLREGYYQSFGKPHDGLGYAPEITHIDHGGTGIAGVVYSTLPDFPPEYRNVLFVGNVITNRVHCDRLNWAGSTPIVTKVEDFITCDDPWFRPVDLQAGPDGALYVADFYNCIIGHYEVPLTHPKRDRERGRIWRVVYTGRRQDQPPIEATPPMPDLYALGYEELFALLAHPNLAVRVLVTNTLVARFPAAAAKTSNELLSRVVKSASQRGEIGMAVTIQACHAIWILQRTASLSEQQAGELMARGVPEDVQVHVTKALGETVEWQSWHFEAVRAALTNDDPFVRRAAAEALAKHPAAANLSPLLELLNKTDQQDAQLYHQIRISLRDQLRNPAVADHLLTLNMAAAERKQLVAFAATAPSGPAATLVFDEALKGGVSDEALLKALPAAARYVDPPRVDAMIMYLQQRFPRNPGQQISAFRALAEGLLERGLPLTKELTARLSALIQTAISGDLDIEWYNSALPDEHAAPSPWVLQHRPRGNGSQAMISSLPANGERLGGILRSPVFEIPSQLHFWMCGHNGLPNAPDRKLNYVRLVLEDGAEVARSYPPRTDMAQPFVWDLRSHAGQRGHVEVVDGITDLDGFAWLAVSSFEPAAISLPDGPIGDKGSVRAELIRLAGQLKLQAQTDDIAAIAEATSESIPTRLAAMDALLALEPSRAVAPLRALLEDADMSTSVREQAGQRLGQIDQQEARNALIGALKSAPESVAVIIASSLAVNKESAAALLGEIQSGRASAGLLMEPTVAGPLKSSGLAKVGELMDELTASLSPTDNRLERLIADRRAGFLAGHHDPTAGRAVFAKSVCANCHRIGDVGKTIGPALDGIGNRGLDRLLEDVLDPSRNVDAAFRTVTIATTDGLTLSGFGLRDEGTNLVFNDANGNQSRVPLAQVEERLPSNVSPMPANVIEQTPEDEFYALLAYLLSLRND